MTIHRARLIVAHIVSMLVVLVGAVSFVLPQMKVIPVPYRAGDDVPHPTFNGTPTTFKAIVRGACPDGVYRWDTDADGDFGEEEEELARQCLPDGTGRFTCYDLGRTVVLPPETSSRLFHFGIRVTCPGEPPVFADYTVFLDAEVPPQTDPGDHRTRQPQLATPAQLAVHRAVAIDDALWYLHLRMDGRSGGGSALTGCVAGSPELPAAGAAAYLLAIQGRLPAYPPGTYAGPRPPGFDAANEARWNHDPYAEDAVRLLNGLLSRLQPTAVLLDDEGDDGLPEIPGTNDGLGLVVAPGEDEVYSQGHALAALAASGLAGTVAQVGDPLHVLGRPVELVAQQMVDWLVFAQIDAMTRDLGGWGRTANPPVRPAWGWDASKSAWAAMGLEAAQRALGPSGVYVNFRCRERLANVLIHDQDPVTGLARSDGDVCTGQGSLGLTGGALVGSGFLGWQDFDPLDPTPLALDYLGNPILRGNARQAVDRYVAGLAAGWVDFQVDCTAFTSGLFDNDGGTHPEPYLRPDGKGNTCALYSTQKGARTLQPELQLVVGPHDPLREFTVYAVRNQAPDGSWLDSPWGGFLASPAYYHEPLTTAYMALTLSVGLGAGTPCVGGDSDGDGWCALADPPDCDDADPATWGVPSEARSLRGARGVVPHEASWSWLPADAPGGTAVVYDVLRSPTPANFAGPTTVCLETDDGADTAAVDPQNPSVGEMFAYLVRAETACGEGSLGHGSSLAPRLGRSCPDAAPVASFTAVPNPASCGQPVVFDASSSYHPMPHRSIAGYRWDFGDGTVVQGPDPVVVHPYQRAGDYPVTLVVTDDSVPPRTGAASGLVRITVGDHPPIPHADGPYTLDIGADLALDGSGSVDPDAPCGDRIVAFGWDLNGDLMCDEMGPFPTAVVPWDYLTQLTPPLLYPADPATGLPTNPVTLRVTDTTGRVAFATSSLTIYDNRPIPRLSVTPNPAGCGQPVTFDATASTHGRPGRHIATYVWDFGDATPPLMGPIVSHAYPQNGDYPVRLTVTDDNSPPRTADAAEIVHVEGCPPGP